jgi:hypothetical protein
MVSMRLNQTGKLNGQCFVGEKSMDLSCDNNGIHNDSTKESIHTSSCARFRASFLDRDSRMFRMQLLLKCPLNAVKSDWCLASKPALDWSVA